MIAHCNRTVLEKFPVLADILFSLYLQPVDQGIEKENNCENPGINYEMTEFCAEGLVFKRVILVYSSSFLDENRLIYELVRLIRIFYTCVWDKCPIFNDVLLHKIMIKEKHDCVKLEPFLQKTFLSCNGQKAL